MFWYIDDNSNDSNNDNCKVNTNDNSNADSTSFKVCARIAGLGRVFQGSPAQRFLRTWLGQHR